MTPHATMPAIEDDIGFYPNHEEADVPEGSLHCRWSGYLISALDARFPDRFVLGNICIYWEPRNNVDYLSPDAFVTKGPVPEPPPRVYRTWLLPGFDFAAEIGSKSNTRAQIEAKRKRYAAFVRPEELLETDPVDEEEGEILTLAHLRLYRLVDTEYQAVERRPNGRFWSATLELEIGVDEANNLRLYTPAGEPVPTHREDLEGRLAAERRVREAELHARTEAGARIAAEERAIQEARERIAAQERAEHEARERATAEQRARESEERATEERAQRDALERELAALRARLAARDDD